MQKILFAILCCSLMLPALAEDMTLTSRVFDYGDNIPKKFTCEGKDISPPLAWYDPPKGTKSLALIMDDPDAPKATWVHWVIYNIPLELDGLSKKLPATANLDNGAIQGINDFKKYGYGGPCPPGGSHRYFFKLYALDKKLNLETGINKRDLQKAMKDHVLATATLMGKYRKKKK